LPVGERGHLKETLECRVPVMRLAQMRLNMAFFWFVRVLTLKNEISHVKINEISASVYQDKREWCF
jgi:hypothetical protein